MNVSSHSAMRRDTRRVSATSSFILDIPQRVCRRELYPDSQPQSPHIRAGTSPEGHDSTAAEKLTDAGRTVEERPFRACPERSRRGRVSRLESIGLQPWWSPFSPQERVFPQPLQSCRTLK